MTGIAHDRPIDRSVSVESAGVSVEADWTVPLHPRGVILVLSGAGCSRFSRRNRQVAHALYDDGFATLLIDLLNTDEEREDELTAALRLDVGMLAERVIAATRWVKGDDDVGHLPIGYLASGVASAAALVAAARFPDDVSAIVSRGGRPDLAGVRLHKVVTPTLLIAGALDIPGIEINRWTLRRLNCEKRLLTIPNAGHRLEEPAAIEATARHSAEWFKHTMPINPEGFRRSIFSINWTERHSGSFAS